MEIRNLTGVTTKGREVSGHAIVFNKWSELLSVEGRRCRELILPGAITQRTLAENDVKCLIDHDGKRLVARSNKGKGSLHLSIDSKGLRFSFTAPNTADGNFIVEMVSRGDLTGCSFAFGGEKSTWEEGNNGIWQRKVHTIKYLSDVSIVQNPAYPDTSVGVRSNQKNNNMEKRDIYEPIMPNWVDQFRGEMQNHLIISKVGIEVIATARGKATYPFIQGSAPTIEMKPVEGLTDQKIRTVTAKPKMIFAQTGISKLAGAISPGLRAGAMKELGRIASSTINKWILSPTPIVDVDGVAGAFVKDAADPNVVQFAAEVPTFEEIVSLETLPLSAGIHDETGMYVVSPEMAKALKTTPKSAGSEMIMVDGKINGYNVYVTNDTPDGFVGFGFFSNVVVNEFDTADIIFDPITRAGEDVELLNINYDADISVLREQAFSAGYTPTGYQEVYP